MVEHDNAALKLDFPKETTTLSLVFLGINFIKNFVAFSTRHYQNIIKNFKLSN